MRRQLAQTRPASTTAATALSASLPWMVDLVLVANVTTSPVTFCLYHDADGTTYSSDTALYFNVSLDGQDTAYVAFPQGIANTDRKGSFGIKANTADSLTFTLYGEVLGERA